MGSASGWAVGSFWVFGLAVGASVLTSGCSAKSCGNSSSFLDGDDGSAEVLIEERSSGSPSRGDGDSLALGSDTNFDAPEPVATHLPADVGLNIEESDLVQVSGSRLYVHSSTRGLNVLDMQDPAHPVSLGQNTDVVGRAGELYVRDASVVVVVGESECALPGELGGWFVPNHHQITSVNTGGEFETLQTMCLPGHLVASRVIDDRLYVLSEYSGVGAALSWLIVLDISQPDALQILDVESFSGAAHEFHVTEREAVVAERVTYASPEVSPEPTPDPEEPPFDSGMGGAGDDSLTWTPAEPPKSAPATGTTAEILATDLRYYSISASTGTLAARGKLRLNGAPQGRFHYNISGDSLRVVTFGGRETGSHVYMVSLKNPDAMYVSGAHYNLAATEDLHAALFVGERLYVVTYEAVILQTDPLWVFDMSGEEPVLKAHLIVPGFSSHLYPLDDKTLMAVGRGDRGAGVAVSLFDVTSISAPFEKARLELGAAEVFTEGNLDYRGINLLNLGKETPVLALPLTRQERVGDTCSHTSSVEFIEVGAELTHRSTVPVVDRPLRTLALDESVISVGDVHVTTFDVANLTTPFVRSTLTIGDETAPISCIEFSEVLGNSPDALDGGDNWGDDWDEGDSWEGDFDSEQERGGCD